MLLIFRSNPVVFIIYLEFTIYKHVNLERYKNPVKYEMLKMGSL